MPSTIDVKIPENIFSMLTKHMDELEFQHSHLLDHMMQCDEKEKCKMVITLEYSDEEDHVVILCSVKSSMPKTYKTSFPMAKIRRQDGQMTLF
jgi:hypothetical protein